MVEVSFDKFQEAITQDRITAVQAISVMIDNFGTGKTWDILLANGIVDDKEVTNDLEVNLHFTNNSFKVPSI